MKVTKSLSVTPIFSTYLGNCIEVFDEYGNCVVDKIPYSDVTEFAKAEEKFVTLKREDFLRKVGRIPSYLLKIKYPIYYYDPKNKIYILYDTGTDVHHFFK